jgi:hypothetical protein
MNISKKNERDEDEAEKTLRCWFGPVTLEQ